MDKGRERLVFARPHPGLLSPPSLGSYGATSQEKVKRCYAAGGLCSLVSVAAASIPRQKKEVFGSLQKKFFSSLRKTLLFGRF
jgi:hypothetical protein